MNNNSFVGSELFKKKKKKRKKRKHSTEDDRLRAQENSFQESEVFIEGLSPSSSLIIQDGVPTGGRE